MFVRHRRMTIAGLITGSAVALCCFPLAGSAGAAIEPVTGLAGGFADSYGMWIDLSLVPKSVPMTVRPVAQASSSCPVTKAPVVVQALQAGDPMAAHTGLVTSGAGAMCEGPSPTAAAKSQVMNADVLGAASPAALHADEITAMSNSSCTAAPGGSTSMTNLTLGGVKIIPDGLVAPNTKVASPVLAAMGITVILNEQHPTASGRGFVVNGMHVIVSARGTALPMGGLLGFVDIVMGHATSGVVCPNGLSSTAPLPGLAGAPDVVFAKTASQRTVKAGETLTYTATVTNNSTTPCEVVRFIVHIAPAFTLVSTAGPFGTTFDTPVPLRTDGGQDAVLRPTAVIVAAKQSVVQTITVKVNSAAVPATYFDTLEMFCAPNGNFASGPLAPVTIVGPLAAQKPAVIVPALPRTGGAPLVAVTALALLGTGVAARKLSRS